MKIRTEQLAPIITQWLGKMNPLLFPKGFGFDLYTEEDVWEYIRSPRQFHFGLKKERGKQLLYGVDHVAVRRAFLNQLPLKDRLRIVEPKLAYYEVPQKLEEILSAPVEIVNAEDIGMGHSVYKLTIKTPGAPPTQWVVKKEELLSQEFHCGLLKVLEWPSFVSRHFAAEKGSIEITEHLDGTLLTEKMGGEQPVWDAALAIRLARYAALGDVLGRGDRHYENYVMKGDAIYPVDISFIFWPKNEKWTAKYVAGGLYEIAILQTIGLEAEPLTEALSQFFKSYRETLDELAGRRSAIDAHIQASSFEKKAEKIAYLHGHLSEPDAFFDRMKHMYLNAFFKMLYRKGFKDILQALVAGHPQILDNRPLLKMYYLADKNRLSTFYLVEEGREYVLETIKLLSDSLGYRPLSWFTEHNARISQLESHICPGLAPLN